MNARLPWQRARSKYWMIIMIAVLVLLLLMMILLLLMTTTTTTPTKTRWSSCLFLPGSCAVLVAHHNKNSTIDSTIDAIRTNPRHEMSG